MSTLNLFMQEDEVQSQAKIISPIEMQIFQYLQISDYQVHDIPINTNESLHTIYIPKKSNSAHLNYYLGHGFAATSLMYFPIISELLQKGNVILWEIRGMGLNEKLKSYEIKCQNQSQKLALLQEFFTSSIVLVMQFYKEKQGIMICHSLSGYMVLILVARKHRIIKHMKQLILLSPVGVTAKEKDYKHSISSLEDLWEEIINKIGWKFNLSYKSPLRTICSCCKHYLVQNSLNETQMNQNQKKIMVDLILTLIDLQDGSQSLFFQYFLPRVLPKLSIEEILDSQPLVDIYIFYGGAEDWVDKTSAYDLQVKYPAKIKIQVIEASSHNFVFCVDEMRAIVKNLPFGGIAEESIKLE